MAKEYLQKLGSLFSELDLESKIGHEVEIKHFFSGAALYVNGRLCVSWSPSGLAFKLSEIEANELIASGKAKPLKYFEKGHIKKGYAVFENPDKESTKQWENFFLKAARQV